MIYPWEIFLSFPYDFTIIPYELAPFIHCLLCPADLFQELFKYKLFVVFAQWCHMMGPCFECFIMNWHKGFEFSIVICHCALFWKASQIGSTMKKTCSQRHDMCIIKHINLLEVSVILYTPVCLQHWDPPELFWNSEMYEFWRGLVLWSPMASSIHMQQTKPFHSVLPLHTQIRTSQRPLKTEGFYGNEESNSEL